MVNFELFFVLLAVFIIAHLIIVIYLLFRIRRAYPDLWTQLGNPVFMTFEGSPRSIFSAKMIKFIFFSDWKNQINDKTILLLRNVVRVTALLGAAGFIVLLVLGLNRGIFVGG